ncbi:MAG: DUF222 domain-containing protein [Acidimicrobiales bacterium]
MSPTDRSTDTNADDVPLDRLEAQITEWSGHLAAATADLLGWIAEYDRREGWKSWTCKSAAHWLSWKCGDTLHTAREKVRVARALEGLPAIAASFRAGELSYSKVRAITRVAVSADDAEWRDTAKHSTGAALERVVAAVRGALDHDEVGDARQAFEKRSLRRSSKGGGVDRLMADAPRDMVETVMAAVDVIATQIVDDAMGDGCSRREVIQSRGGTAAIRVDALVRMAERTLAAAPAAAERGDIGRLQLNLDTDDCAEDADGGEGDGAGEQTLAGRRVSTETAKRWACDTRAAVMLEHDGHPADCGRDSRTVNRRLRRALHRRDHGTCRFPGCAASSWLHAHHVVHWAEGGHTDLDNLVSLCGFHHHAVHEGGWSVAVVDHTVVWSDPDGVPATVEPLTGSAQPVGEAGRRADVDHSSIESRWVNDRLDFGFVVSVIIEHCIAARSKLDRVPAGTLRPSGPTSEP